MLHHDRLLAILLHMQLLDHLLALVPTLPEVVVLLTVRHAPVSNVTAEERFLVQPLDGVPHIYQVVARYGYMDQPCHNEVCASFQLNNLQLQFRPNAFYPGAGCRVVDYRKNTYYRADSSLACSGD
jgi:K+ transporter